MEFSECSGYHRIVHITGFFFLLTTIGLGTVERAGFNEIDVTVADGVEGKIVTPARGENALTRAVLLLHGWTGKMDGVGDMFKRLAAELGDAEIASLRINFRGEGVRNGHRLTSTFATRIADAEAALAMMHGKFPGARIGVVGFSLGGATALALTGRHPEAVASLVLWSTSGNPVVDLLGYPENSGGHRGHREAIEKGQSTVQSWAELTLTREHLMGFIGYDLMGPLRGYQGALFLIRGSDDFLKRYEDQILDAVSGWREEFLIIGGANHIFHTLDPKSVYDERVIVATLLWLTETL